MSRASRIIVADADSKNAGLLAFGFEREGLEPLVVHAAADVARMAIAGDVDAVVLAMSTGAEAAEALKTLRAAGPMVARLPVVVLGEAAARAEVAAAGAADFLARPNFVRDVVALARFHTLRKPSSTTVWAGELHDFAGIFYLIRGLSSAGRTGVLTIVRSLRRAELRFYEGEITSAQVGSLHGMAALHQVLLWTEGKLDFRAESVVRRQQIPLQPAELIEDLGRFLRDFHELAPELGPGVVLAQDLRRVAECVDKIPKEVNPVLRLFDGSRMLSDIVEDSPFRVFETVKIAARLVKLGALKAVAPARASVASNAALRVDDWMVGSTPVQGVPAVVSGGERDSEPVGPRPGVPASAPAAVDTGASLASARQKKKAKKEREREAATRPAAAAPVPAPVGDGVVVAPAAPTVSEAADWGRLTGAAASVWDLPGYAPVVPSQVVAGEIASSRPAPDVNLAVAGKVVAQDLAQAVQHATRQAVSGPTVLVDETAGSASVPSIRGKAAERVDEISAPIPREIPVTPVTHTLPGPAPVPVPVAPAVLRAPPVVAAAPVVAAPAPAPARPAPITTPPVESRMHAQTSQADRNGVVSGVLSGDVEARSHAPGPSEPEAGEKIVVIDADFDPPRPPSVEMEIVHPPPDLEDAGSFEDDARTAADAPAAPPPAPAPAPVAAATPVLRSIADEEPSDAAARLPKVLVAPLVAPAAIAAPPAPDVPEVVVVSTPSAPTVQIIAAPAIIPAEPAPVVPLPPPAVVVAPAAATIAAPPARVADAADEVTKGAADAAHAAARALSFDAIDEEFFSQEQSFANAKAHSHESFDDLDGHHHGPAPKRGFWSRLLGTPAPQPQRRRRPTTVPPPTAAAPAARTTGPQKTQTPSQSGPASKPGNGQKNKKKKR